MRIRHGSFFTQAQQHTINSYVQRLTNNSGAQEPQLPTLIFYGDQLRAINILQNECDRQGVSRRCIAECVLEFEKLAQESSYNKHPELARAAVELVAQRHSCLWIGSRQFDLYPNTPLPTGSNN